MSDIKSYKSLIVWQKALELVKETFRLTRHFPKEETYGIVAQMRRAAVSIPSNITEASGRSFPAEWKHFYAFAYGSTLELETQLIISRDLSLANSTEFDKAFGLVEEVSKMLRVMVQRIKPHELTSNQLVSSN